MLQKAPPLLSCDVISLQSYLSLVVAFRGSFKSVLNSPCPEAVGADRGLAFLNHHEQIYGKGLYLTTVQRKYAGHFSRGQGDHIWDNKRKEFVC